MMLIFLLTDPDYAKLAVDDATVREKDQIQSSLNTFFINNIDNFNQLDLFIGKLRVKMLFGNIFKNSCYVKKEIYDEYNRYQKETHRD